jgi:hypothetical protein
VLLSLAMKADRQKFTIEVPLENPDDAQSGMIELTAEEKARIDELMDDQEGLLNYIAEIRAKRAQP